MSRVMRKPSLCICENKDADQRLCFRYTDITIPLLYESEISSIQPSSVAVQPGLCRTRSGSEPERLFSRYEAHLIVSSVPVSISNLPLLGLDPKKLLVIVADDLDQEKGH